MVEQDVLQQAVEYLNRIPKEWFYEHWLDRTVTIELRNSDYIGILGEDFREFFRNHPDGKEGEYEWRTTQVLHSLRVQFYTKYTNYREYKIE